MYRVWRELRKQDINPLTFLSWVHNSFDYADFEAVRQNPGETGNQLDKIERLLTDLKSEIEQSPLPRNQATAQMGIDHPSLPPVELSIGWHGMNPEHDWIGYPISVHGVLSVALGMLAKHREREPLRLVARQRGRGDNVEIVSFVRHMAYLSKHHTGKTLAGSLAHVTNAIYDPENPLDKEAASDMIKKSPAKIRPERTTSDALPLQRINMKTNHQSAPALTPPPLTMKLLRLHGVEEKTGLKKSAIYAAMANKDDPFPAPVRIGARAVAWPHRGKTTRGRQMIDALIAGRLRGAVAVRQSTNGNTFATWRIAAAGKDGESLLCSCISFSQKAIAAMQALDDGDSVAVSGEASISVWADAQKGQCHGLNVQVYAVMTAYHLGRKRKAHEAQNEGKQ
eukprot:gene24072-30374_t